MLLIWLGKTSGERTTSLGSCLAYTKLPNRLSGTIVFLQIIIYGRYGENLKNLPGMCWCRTPNRNVKVATGR